MSARKPLINWLAAPAFSLFGLFFLLPLALLFVVSFWRVSNFKLAPALSIAAYWRTFAEFGGVLAMTILIGLTVAALSTIIGFIFAYGARFHGKRYADGLILLVMISLFGGYLTKIYAWKSVLAQDGLINSALLNLGLIDAPLAWLIYSPFAVVLALTHFLLPFAVLPIHAELKNVDIITLEAARDLGASRRQVLHKIVLPQIRRGLFAAFALTFLAAAGDYVTPLFLGSGGGMMIGQFIALEFSTRFNWPGGAAMSFCLMAACGLIISAFWVGLVRGKS